MFTFVIGLIISVHIFILWWWGDGGGYTHLVTLATIQEKIRLEKKIYQKFSGEPFITILS